MPTTQEERTALARAALVEVVDPGEVGALIAVEQPEPGVIDLRFACTLAAYTGWSWVVSTSDLDGVEPTVLEVELLPGEGALLAPPWVPWTERLAEWRRQHPDERHPGEPGEDEAPEDDEAEVDEEDLGDDDGLDELDEAELEGALPPEDEDEGSDDEDSEDEDSEDEDEGDDDAAEDDPDEGDPDDEQDDDVRGPRPAEEDRSL